LDFIWHESETQEWAASPLSPHLPMVDAQVIHLTAGGKATAGDI